MTTQHTERRAGASGTEGEDKRDAGAKHTGRKARTNGTKGEASLEGKAARTAEASLEMQRLLDRKSLT